MRAVDRAALALVVFALHRPPAAAAPEAAYFYPGGGQRGQTVVVSVGGSLPHWPVSFWSSCGEVKVAAMEEKGQAQIEIPSTVETGVIWLRSYDQDGASAPRPWVIGSTPEVVEQEPNDQLAESELVPCADAPLQTVAVNGRLDPTGDVDVFAVDVREGQTLVADVDAHAVLASAFDGVLQILRPDGFVAAHNDDCQGLDPQVATVADQSGRWMVRVFGFPETPTQQVQLAGDAAYVYRLTLSTGPVVHHALPLAARRDHCVRFAVHGWNLTDGLRSVSLRPDSAQSEVAIGERVFGRTIRLPLFEFPVRVEAESDDDAQPTVVELPTSVSGRINRPGDRDAIHFDVVKDETVSIDLRSRDLGFPLDGVLELFDAKDQRVARVDDNGAQRDPRLQHRAAADGRMRLVVSDLHGRGGPEFAYRVTIVRSEPSFRLTSESHQAVVKPGETTDVPVNVERQLGFDEAIEFHAEGLPRGVVANSPISKPGDDESAVKVVIALSAADDVAPASAPFVIVGKSTSAGSEPVRFSTPGHPTGLSDLWLTVTK
ncbi:MAG: PPC domain-containing protein [Planctomycetota bacterium]